MPLTLVCRMQLNVQLLSEGLSRNSTACSGQMPQTHSRSKRHVLRRQSRHLHRSLISKPQISFWHDRGQSFHRLTDSPTAPTAPPPRGPAWPATRKTRPNHTPASPPPGTPRRTGPTHPQRRSPGCRLPERLRRPPAASLAATTFAPRVHHGPVPPHPARRSVPPHPARPPQRVGWSPQRPRPTSAAAACLARHLQRSHARPNRHLASPPCGAPEGDLPEPRRWKVAVGVGRGARVATSRFGAPAAAASANAAVPRTMQPGTPH
jgi:hypothetical protein